MNKDMKKSDEKDKGLKMYGAPSLRKKMEAFAIEEKRIQAERAKTVEILKKRFFDFLANNFYKFIENGIKIKFAHDGEEMKLMDIQYQGSYWVIFEDALSGKSNRYLVHCYPSSCTILEVYEKIQLEVIPMLMKNIAKFEREEKLNNLLNEARKEHEIEREGKVKV